MIWFHRIPADEMAADFRTQTYLGQPVLTWFQGAPNWGPFRAGPTTSTTTATSGSLTVRAGNGYAADGQEFLITPWNTALILTDTMTTANLTSIGGPADQRVIDGLVQEIDISTGHVLFQRNAASDVPDRDSEQPRPASAATPGTGSTSTPSIWTPTEICGERPPHLDDFQGEPAHR